MIWLRVLALLLIGAPVLAGAGMTLLTALGWQPAFGRTDLSLAGFREVLAVPGLWTSLRLTLLTGIGASVLSLAVSIPIARWVVSRGRGAGWLAPWLAVPHAALAIGLAFLLAPSGWIARMLAPLAGWEVPLAFVTVGDPAGVALILGLMLKEVPFLVLVTLAAAAQQPVAAQMAAGRSLGYPPARVWARGIWPVLYPSLRLPIFIVLAFSLSVVDVALVLGPGHPPTLAVLILRRFADPDPAQAVVASALAVGLLAVMAGLVLLWFLAERVIARFGADVIARGARGRPRGGLDVRVPMGLGAMLGLGAFGALALWSLARRWPFPSILPESWSFARWAEGAWLAPAAETLGLGAAAVALSLLLAVVWLETEDRSGTRAGLGAVIVLPLLLPQIGFLQGLTSGFIWLGLPPGRLAVLWALSLFVFPYVMIALAGPWRALDPAQIRSAASLGAGSGRRLWAVKLPILLRPLMVAAAVGFAVAAAQYLAVLLPGAGRVRVLATEAVALSSGADRRIAAVQALALAALPLIVYALALGLPAWLYRDRAGLRGGGHGA